MTASGPPATRTVYAVCTTPRSGSGLTCEALWNTGLAGKPDEYFHQGTREIYLQKWQVSSTADYAAAFCQKTASANGVLGFKVMREHFDNFRREFMNDRSLLPFTLENLRYIWLVRQDKVRQAVSLWKRLETGLHRSSTDAASPPPTPRYNFDRIRQLVKKFEAWDASWKEHFEREGIEPLQLTYEDDVDGRIEETVSRILAWIGVPRPESLVTKTTRQRQSDALSEEFVRRYHEDLGRGDG